MKSVKGMMKSGKRKPQARRNNSNIPNMPNDPNNTGHSSSWWDDINTQSSLNQNSTPLQGKLKRGNVQRNRELEQQKQQVPAEQENKKPLLINLDVPSPLIWTSGTFVIYIVVFICELIQSGGFSAMKVNPLGGPSNDAMILMGAKYGPSIIAGDWWRFLTCIFLSSGVLHLVLLFYLKFITVPVERESGFWRAVVVYIASGAYGAVLSCLFVPELISTGSTGAAFGYIGLLMCDLISSWRMFENPGRKLGLYILSIVVTIIVGLTPYLDNFVHVGGFIIGVLCAFMLLPNLSYTSAEQKCRGLMAFIAFPLATIIFCVSVVYFYRRLDASVSWCPICNYINCVNISGWCPPITKEETVTHYLN